MKISSFLATIGCATSALAAFDLNRAGAVLKAPEGDSFTSVGSTFTVPSLSGTNRLSIWVGIGDSLQQTYVLGGGILFNRTLSSWTAFFPDQATDTTSQVPVANGNSITVTVTAQAGGGGSVTIENKTQNKKVTKTIAAPTGADPTALTATTADWWVQAYQVVPGELVKTPNFGTISFTGCTATTNSGANVPLSSAGPYEIQGTSGQMYSKTTISGTTIQVKRQT